MKIKIKDVVVNYENEFKKLVPQMRRAAKRLKHAKPRTRDYYKEERRLKKLQKAPYLQEA